MINLIDISCTEFCYALVLHLFFFFLPYVLLNLLICCRFSLATPAPLAQLWLQVLCSVWAEEATSVVYLMDIVLRVAFFRSEVKIAASDILSQLLQVMEYFYNDFIYI